MSWVDIWTNAHCGGHGGHSALDMVSGRGGDEEQRSDREEIVKQLEEEDPALLGLSAVLPPEQAFGPVAEPAPPVYPKISFVA
jgi:hypothetical protein